jgi:hypothetical protein
MPAKIQKCSRISRVSVFLWILLWEQIEQQPKKLKMRCHVNLKRHLLHNLSISNGACSITCAHIFCKNSCSRSGCSRRNIASKERRLWKRGGRWKGGRGCRTIRSASAGRRGSHSVCIVAFARKVVQISQQTRKVAGGVSVICPNNRKRLTFVGQHARHGRQNALP